MRSPFPCSPVIREWLRKKIQIEKEIRSSRSQMFFKIGVFKKCAVFVGKRQCWSLFFNEVAGLQLFFCEYCEIFK